MYNSLFLSILSRLGRQISLIYKNSIIYKLLTFTRSFFIKTYDKSEFKAFMRRVYLIFVSSLTYRIVVKIFSLLDRFLNFLNSIIRKLSEGSIISRGLGFYSKDEIQGLRLFYEVFIISGILLLVLNVFKISYLPVLFSLGLVLVGIFGLLINGKELEILRTSIVFNFFFDLFKLDEGGESWW